MSDHANDRDFSASPGDAPDPNFETAPTKVKRKLNETLDQAEAVTAKALGAERASRMRAKAGATVDQGEDFYYDALDRIDARLRDRPYQTLGITLAVGVALGFLMAGSRRTVIYRTR